MQKKDLLNFWSTVSRRDWVFFFCLVFVAALFSSKYVLSLCTIFLAALAVFDLQMSPFRIRINPSFLKLSKHIRKRPDIAAISLIFFTYLLFGIGSENTAQWMSMVRMKISFLVWPVIFLVLPPLHSRHYKGIFYFLLLNAAVSALFVTIAYVSNTYLFNQSLGFGHSLPTPINHIRYSMLVALSVLGGIVLYLDDFFWRWKNEKYLIGVLTLLLFAFLHLLSVRTGLVLCYAGILVLIVIQLIRTPRKPWVILVALGLCFLPYLAYQNIPAFERKVGYTLYDIDKWREGSGSGYADSERLRSWDVGLQLALSSPITGVGVGDLRQKVIDTYKTKFDSDQYWKPHNQYISVFAAAGMLGLLLMLFGFLFPILYRNNHKNTLLLLVFILFGLSMLVESSLDNYIGSAMFLILALTGLSSLGEQQDSSNGEI